MDKTAFAVLAIDAGAAQALLDGTLGDPFSVLGPHAPATGQGQIVRVFLPGADAVEVLDATSDVVLAQLQPLQIPGLFAGLITEISKHNSPAAFSSYCLRIHWPTAIQITEDPYAFGLLLGELDLHLFAEGNHFELASCLGAQLITIDSVSGVRFAVWAPNARRVSVVGAFNNWDGRRHPMRKRVEAGVWELFVPRLQAGELYQYEILGPEGLLPLKTDPVAQQVDLPPRTAAIVARKKEFVWNDSAWMQTRAAKQSAQQPLSIYEVHAASWRRILHDQNRSLNWDELAAQLIPYVCDLGFTHIELLPIMAHPFGGSWGYQPLGLFAPQASFGEPAAFARFIDACHAQNIGVILDWVPAHFPSDAHGLARFDGTSLYEHADPREGFHQDWNTLIYNLGRREVHGFLLASALHWIEHFHIDGLRVDAVASMLYRDYSRGPGQWVPNRHGGRENLEAVEFLRHLNEVITQRCHGALVIAEESTAWPGVTQATQRGGLGFSFKWNMGWMHDTLTYMTLDPVYRAFNNDKMTFSLVYAFSENFVLALSHDEVVHGKGSLLRKMSGDRWQQFANLRAYYGFVWTHPGKKLLFMGSEFAQEQEWNHDLELNWYALENPLNRGMHRLVRDLNDLYRTQPALYTSDCDGRGFQWVVCDDAAQSVFAFCRSGTAALAEDRTSTAVLVVCNFTPVPRYGYRLGVPTAGHWREVLNSDADIYGGSNIGNIGGVMATEIPSHGFPFSIEVTAPPLATTIFIGEFVRL